MRKVVLNLTPLLDLLLILIFASQLNTWMVALDNASKAEAEINRLKAEQELKESEIDAVNRKLVSSLEQNIAYEQDLMNQAFKVKKLEDELAVEQKRVAVAVSVLMDLAKRHKGEFSGAEVKKISEIADKFSFEKGDLVKSIGRCDDLKKITSFWHIKLENDYRMTLKDDSETVELFLGENIASEGPNIVEGTRKLATPRKVVFLFFSYSDVLISRRDSADSLLATLVRESLPNSYQNTIFYLVGEGYTQK